jgi:hypothetical protein
MLLGVTVLQLQLDFFELSIPKRAAAEEQEKREKTGRRRSVK